MIKKAYEKPEMNVENIQQAQMLCVSGVETFGLDDDESLHYDSDNRSGSTWDDAM